tara:strand:+ start:807 stop:998 length:192 start_codon:yes stop_codon:yes gene_type:complete
VTTLLGSAQRRKKQGQTAGVGGSALPSGTKSNSPAQRIADRGKTKGVVRTSAQPRKKQKKSNY